MTTKPDLLPCPFCGGTSVSVEEGSTFRWRIPVCDECGAQGPEIRHNTLSKDRALADEKSKADALDAWNTRGACRAAAVSEPTFDPKAVIQKVVDGVMSQREEILRAFIAKYGFGPEEAVQITDGLGWRVIRREDTLLAPAPAPPAGMVVVPKEPSPAMLYALYGPDFMTHEDAWKAMLAAAAMAAAPRNND